MIVRFVFPWDEFRNWAISCYRDGIVPLGHRAQMRWQHLSGFLPALPWRVALPVVIALIAFANARSVLSPSAVGQSFASPQAPMPVQFAPPSNQREYAWINGAERAELKPLCDRIAPGAGWRRLSLPSGSFGDWLRHLPMQSSDVLVRDFRKRPVDDAAQDRSAGCFALHPNTNQLGPAAMMVRLRAEYLWAAQAGGAASFHFNTGQRMDWLEWSRGMRASFETGTLRFVQMGKEDTSRSSYCAYLESLFQHTGSQSLLDDTRPVTDGTISVGDILIRSHAGDEHAAMIVDLAVDANGQIAVMLAQGSAPAATLHLCANETGSPWHVVYRDGVFDLGPNGRMHLSTLRRWH